VLVENFELPQRTTPLVIKQVSNSLNKTHVCSWRLLYHYLKPYVPSPWCLPKFTITHISRKIAKLWSLLYYLNLLSSKILNLWQKPQSHPFILSIRPWSFLLTNTYVLGKLALTKSPWSCTFFFWRTFHIQIPTPDLSWNLPLFANKTISLYDPENSFCFG
jgi:hypothetical protein